MTGFTDEADEEDYNINEKIFQDDQLLASEQNFRSFKSEKSLDRHVTKTPIRNSLNKHKSSKRSKSRASGNMPKAAGSPYRNMGSDGYDQSPINSDQEFSINPSAYDELQ